MAGRPRRLSLAVVEVAGMEEWAEKVLAAVSEGGAKGSSEESVGKWKGAATGARDLAFSEFLQAMVRKRHRGIQS